MFGMAMPTASGSISAWMFIITGGLCGFFLWLAISASVTSAWNQPKEPLRASSTNEYLPGVELYRNKQNQSNLMFYRLLLLTLAALVAGGAQAGKWTHQKFGSTIASRMFGDSSPSSSKSQTPSPASGQHKSKPTQSSTQNDLSNKTNPNETSKTMKLPPSNASLTSLLRILLIFEIVYGVIVLAIGFIESYIEGQFWAEIGLNEEISNSEMFAFAIAAVALVVLLPVTIASWIGLFQQRNWARWLYLAVSASSILLGVFVGCFQWNYRWGLVTGLEASSGVVTGIILAICFLSPLAVGFTSEEECNESNRA